MSPSFQRNKGWIRIVSIILIVTFINQDLVWAQDGATALSKETAGSFSLPKDLATAKDVHVTKSGKTIINIQDAHASIGAQESIVSVLDSLVANYDLKLIAVEGSSGYIDTSLLRSFPDKKIRDRTAESLMRKGRMSAAELFSITHDNDVALYGIEDSALYKENVEQFRRIYEMKDAVGEDIKELRAALDALRLTIYPKEIIDLETNASRHMAGEITFAARWDLALKLAVSSNLDYKKYDNLTRLADSLKLEAGIDFEKANKERDRLIDELTKKLSKPELEDLVLRSLSHKTGKLSRGDYHLYLEELALRCNIDGGAYKELASYTRYITVYESIDVFGVFEEIAAFEDSIKESSFTDKDQLDLYRFTKFAGSVNDLFGTKLTGSDFDRLSKSLSVCSRESMEEFIRSASSRYSIRLDGNYDINKIFSNIPAALEFYKTAEERNSVMLANTIDRMGEENRSVAALITGGYHTAGITQLLKDKQTSYLVILPKFDPSKGDRPYVAILTNKKASYDPLLKSGQYYLATSAYFEGVRHAASLDEMGLLKARLIDAFTLALFAWVTGEHEDDAAKLAFEAMRENDPQGLLAKTGSLIDLWSGQYASFYRSAKWPRGFEPMSPKEFSGLLRSMAADIAPAADTAASSFAKLKEASPDERRRILGSERLSVIAQETHVSVFSRPDLDYVVKVRNSVKDPNNSFSNYIRYAEWNDTRFVPYFMADCRTFLSEYGTFTASQTVVVQRKAEVLSDLMDQAVQEGRLEDAEHLLDHFADVHVSLLKSGSADKVFMTRSSDRRRRYLANIAFIRQEDRWAHLDCADLIDAFPTDGLSSESIDNIKNWFPYRDNPRLAAYFDNMVVPRIVAAFPARPTPDLTGARTVASHLIEDFDSLMRGADEYRVKHARVAIDMFDQFTRGRDGFEFLYRHITNPIVQGKTADKVAYFAVLQEALDIYNALTEEEKAALRIGVILHDVGFASIHKAWDHWRTGAEAVEPILRRYGVTDQPLISNVRDVVRHHSKVADLGLDYLPQNFSSMSNTLKVQLLIISMIDSAAKLERRPPHGPDNILSTQITRELIDNYRRLDTIEPGPFLDYRLTCAGMSRTFQLSREGLELSDDEVGYLQRMARGNEVFSNVWSTNIRNQVFPLFMRLRQNSEGPAKVERLYKLMLLIAYTSKAYFQKLGAEPILTLDSVSTDFSDEYFDNILRGMDSFFAMDLNNITEDAVREELERTQWTSAFGLHIKFEDDKILIGEDTALPPGTAPPHAFKPVSGWSLIGLGGGVDWITIFGAITGYLTYYTAANWNTLTSIGMAAMPILAIITFLFAITSYARVRDCVRATRAVHPDFTLWQALRNDIGHDNKALTFLKNNYRYTYLQIFCHETFETHVLGLMPFIPRPLNIKSIFSKRVDADIPPHAFRILGFGGIDWVLIAGAITAYSARYAILNFHNFSLAGYLIVPSVMILALIFAATSTLRVFAAYRAIRIAHSNLTLWQTVTHDIGHDNDALIMLKYISPYTYNQILFHETFKFHSSGLATFIPGVKAPVLVQFEEMIEKLVRRGRMPVIVSDLDGTLSESNLPITPEMADAIIGILKGGSTFALLSGISKSRVEKQFIRPLLARLNGSDRDILNNLIIGSDNGTQIYRYDKTMRDFKCIYAADIRERMSVGKYNEIFHHIYQCIDKCNVRGMLKDIMGWEFTDEQWEKFRKECVVKRKVGDKVTQITFMVIGHEATHEQKEMFQGKGGDAIRERYQKFIQDEFNKNGIDLDVKANGLSSIDITLSGIEKGFGIRTISKLFSIPLNCIIFFGDAFSPGRNDEPAIKVVDRVVNVGRRVDITKSSYYRKTVRFLQMAKGGPRGARLFAEAFARQIRRLAPASRTSVYADAMTSEEALDTFNSPEFGQDNTGAILFKMGLPEVMRRAVIERLHKSGISTYRFARVDNAVGFNALMTLWGDGITKSLDDMEKSGLDVSEGRRTFVAKEDAQFTDWIYRLYNEVVVDNPEKYSKEAIKYVKTLVYSLDCLNRSVEVVLVKSRVPRSELVRAYTDDEETANAALRGILGGESATYEDCAFQDFLKYIVVGATNVNEAHQFSLRGGIIKPDLTPEGSLKEFVHSARHFEVPDGTTASIANGIHCAGSGALETEKGVYKAIEEMSDASRGGVSEAAQISVPGTEIDHDSVINIGEVTRSGFLKDIVERRYAEIESSLGLRGRSVLPAEYCKNGGTIKHERIVMQEISRKNIPEGLEVDLIQTPWRTVYRRRLREDVSYSVDQPHGPAANEKVCAFCHLPKEEILFNVIINGSEYMVAVNIRPFGDKHLILISKDPEAQDLSKRMEDVLLFVNAMGPEYEAVFNSPGAAASKLHFHAQVFKTRSPLRDNMTKGLVTRSGTVEDNGVRKSMLLGWFGDVKELVGNNPNRLAEEAQIDIETLKKEGISYSSVMFVKRNGDLSVFTIPRESEAPYESLKFDSEGVTKFGANDIAGNVVVNSPGVRDAIVKDPTALANALYAATKRGILSARTFPEYMPLASAAEKITALKYAMEGYVEFSGNVPTRLMPDKQKEGFPSAAVKFLTGALNDSDADVSYIAARCILLAPAAPDENVKRKTLSVWLHTVADEADNLFAMEEYTGASITYADFLNSEWLLTLRMTTTFDLLSDKALDVIIDTLRNRKKEADRRAAEAAALLVKDSPASDLVIGIPKSFASPGLAKSIRDMADAEFPKLRVAIFQMDEDSPDALLLEAQARKVRHGVVLDLPAALSLSAARSYLESLEGERFEKDRPDITILNRHNIVDLSKDELEAKVRAIEESLPAVSATSIEELKTMLVTRSRGIGRSFTHANSPQLNTFNIRKTRAVSVTTQGVLEGQMMYALSEKIKARWAAMGVKSREEDPVKEIVAITSAGMSDEAARKYVELQGLEGYVEIRMARTDDEKALLSRELFSLKQEFKHAGIRSTKSEEFDHLSDLDLTVLELGDSNGACIDTNSYETLFELFIRPAEWKLIPGISKDEARKIFIYIPRSVPFNYEKEIRQQQEALKILLQAA